jgi:hypothetical protein
MRASMHQDPTCGCAEPFPAWIVPRISITDGMAATPRTCGKAISMVANAKRLGKESVRDTEFYKNSLY